MIVRQYTSKKREQAIRFELDGEQFEAIGGASLLDLSELARLADFDAASPAGFAALADFFKGALGEADYERLRRHIRQHGTDPDTLLSIMEGIVEDAATFPTQGSSPSSIGPTATGATYRVVSPSRGTVVVMPLTPEREAELRAAVERARATG